MQLAAHIVNGPTVFILLVNVVLVGKEQIEKPAMEFLVE